MAKLNMQNIPARRKDIKRVFKARPGYSIINSDLGTAEVWVAAALSGDTFLQQAFIDDVDFHSYIAKEVFKLDCPIDQIKDKYKDERQASKAITFGIMYGASDFRIFSEMRSFGLKVTIGDARRIIKDYFENASKLKTWLNNNGKELLRTGEILYAQGRVRTIPEVFSSQAGEVDHAIRSGLNSLFQGPASDITVMGTIDLFNNFILPNDYISKDMVRPFTIVHDSLTSEVHNSVLEDYKVAVTENWQKPRYFIPEDFRKKAPIKVDHEVGPTWGDVS